MNPKLISEVKKRVRQFEQKRVDESVLSAHLDAIAEVYKTDRDTVESIARKVIDEGTELTPTTDWVKLRNILWVMALVLVIFSVMWLLYNSTQTSGVSNSDKLSKKNERVVRYVQEALVSLNIVKISVAEHVQAMGEMPSSFSEIGIKESELVATKYIDRLQLNDGGIIFVSLSELIGKQRYLELKPVLRIANYQLEWECRSNLDLIVLDEINGCTPSNAL